MKKAKIILILSIVFCVLLTGCGKLSKSKAEDIALAELGLNRTTTPKIESELDSSSDPPVYKVIFYQPDVNQIVLVNAETGEVISVTEENANRD